MCCVATAHYMLEPAIFCIRTYHKSQKWQQELLLLQRLPKCDRAFRSRSHIACSCGMGKTMCPAVDPKPPEQVLGKELKKEVILTAHQQYPRSIPLEILPRIRSCTCIASPCFGHSRISVRVLLQASEIEFRRTHEAKKRNLPGTARHILFYTEIN